MAKYALITGASSGIGLAISQRLLADGFVVVASGRSVDRLQDAFAATAAADRTRLQCVCQSSAVFTRFAAGASETLCVCHTHTQ